ncbi:hypothetical protein COOONC_19723 [Cooperia oncophora]
MFLRGAVRAGGGVSLTATRSVSSKYPKPVPRPYRRRLFEAAVAPVLPEKINVCSPNVFKRGVEAEVRINLGIVSYECSEEGLPEHHSIF